MALIPISEDTLRPSFVYQPDTRFATAFISNEYRDFAVRGETIQDKSSGEIFIKRPEDGRVVSFFQNKKFIDDLMLNMKVSINTNADFIYPTDSTENTDIFYAAIDYDMMEIKDNQTSNLDVLTNPIISTYPNNGNTYNYIKFRITPESNGFLIRPTSRDCDRALIQYAAAVYNDIVASYTGSDSDYVTQKNLLTGGTGNGTDSKWYSMDSILQYDIVAFRGTAQVGRVENVRAYIRINEICFIKIPDSIFNIGDATYFEITIKQFEPTKVNFVGRKLQSLGTKITNNWTKLLYPDKKIYVNYLSVYSYIPSVSDLIYNGNEQTIALVDVPSVCRYMVKLGSIITANALILSDTRPHASEWPVNGVWGELIREVYGGGLSIEHDHEIDLEALEEYLTFGNFGESGGVDFTTDSTRYEDIFVDTSVDGIDNITLALKAGDMVRRVSSAIKNIVSTQENDTADEGMYMKIENDEGSDS